MKPLHLALFVLVVQMASFSAAQMSDPFPRRQSPQPNFPTDQTLPEDKDHERHVKELEKQEVLKRHRQLREDAAKLLQLSKELKEYVDKADENVLSLDVIRKADEIERLSKSVREKMKGTN